ncbi:DUF3127 domain-containing protein [Muribaculaceae bacterium Isolate-007 (NCI)]|nr:DUF3127 domain-containing protein [Muribaculaceae bacterium Isolate-100 (HZI)]RXE66258.1 DUF3127 domain-containing protein [Muribaculaceae bacterium Isolate-007 (NCI)]
MIKFTATALIHFISPVIDIPSRNGGQSFQKRELMLDDSWTKDGNTYTNFVLIEFSGDKISQLDNFVPGQRVTVEAFINGREYQGRYFNTIKGMAIAPYQAQQTTQPTGQPSASAPSPFPGTPQQQYAPAPGYAPQPAYPPQAGYPHPPQPSYPNQGGYANSYPQPAPAPMPEPQPSGNLGPEGLPFR